MNKKQIVVGVAVIAIMGYLYSLPVKGLTKSKETGTPGATMVAAGKPAVSVTEASVSAIAKPNLDAAQLQQVNSLEAQIKSASGEAKPALQRALAAIWDAATQPAPAAFNYQAIAQKSNDFADWVNAGNRFNEAYKASQDTAAQMTFSANAVEAFESAIKLKPADLEAKTGLGVAIVNGGGAPMKGIGLLLEVVKQEPDNHAANLNLGMFAMKSGQFDKAAIRFKRMTEVKEEVEPYFYLAEAYKQLGQKKEAIAAYEKCKELMGDPVAGQRIDEYIKELKK
ncbi:tetratricopeptide repeat protein [Mucilaginibacter glaciei]|uniref:Tetratricopeptide repeat protein n=1 Tax=Mucilaginibacter glaciei TaxID=2772109 RepID=A0A926S3S1_9SPHI|nr:tetratricopeptide repeat protein [Mucilaginibacter glaciei]MBD1395202.1 tetratricopeptide repeat protein [Mucilaginibacter glaciei]